MGSLLYERLKVLIKPGVIFWHKEFRHEGLILSIDEKYIEFHDPVRNYRKFFKLDEVDDLEVKE